MQLPHGSPVLSVYGFGKAIIFTALAAAIALDAGIARSSNDRNREILTDAAPVRKWPETGSPRGTQGCDSHVHNSCRPSVTPRSNAGSH